MPIRLLIADDHLMIRVGLKYMLAGSGIKVVAEASTGPAALRGIAKYKPDVVLLDVRMAGGDGLNTLGRIKIKRPELPVLIFSAFDNSVYIARAAELGASGYLLKGTSREKLIESIKIAVAGKNIRKHRKLRGVGTLLATPRSASEIDVLLTQRENQVLRLVVLGLTNREIAMKLKIGVVTVKDFMKNILGKLGVTRSDASRRLGGASGT